MSDFDDYQRHVFQHTAARRRLEKAAPFLTDKEKVSTHSRPKAAGISSVKCLSSLFVSTHSRPKAAGIWDRLSRNCQFRFQHTAARRRLAPRAFITYPDATKFQHTAARRRLAYIKGNGNLTANVSTHSRPKAAGNTENLAMFFAGVSTHSRPKAAGQ